MKKMTGLIVAALVMVWAAVGSAQTNLVIDRDTVSLGGRPEDGPVAQFRFKYFPGGGSGREWLDSRLRNRGLL